MSATKVDEHAENTCVVCCREVYIFAIGECDHPVCFECATRMRVLCKQNECPICRRELPKILFVKNRRQYADVANIRFPFWDRKYNLYFEDEFVRQAHYRLLEHRCHICENEPSFSTFVALKDHVRKSHELFFCDICIKHLLIFTCERKCYNRQELATHRRLGDADDKSHRGHPLCEFCNDRFLDDDELFRHLRREHFFCHFCDTDGHNHFYSDYEYLRKHFRAEHFLCEEGGCLNEKFTTAFRSEIDLIAHRAAVHNKGLTKAQSKQARTLELEFSIAPRGAGNSEDMPSRTYYDADDPNSRRGGRRRGGCGGFGNSHRGTGRDYAQQRYNLRFEDANLGSELVQEPAMPSPKINMNSSQDFPVLGLAPNTHGASSASAAASASSGSKPDTLARKLAKINRFTVGSGMGDEEFPALRPGAGPMPAAKIASKFKGSNSWGTSGSATHTLSMISSAVPSPSNASAGSRKTLTVKLNSQDDFPGLVNAKKPNAAPKLSIQVDHKQQNTKVANANSTQTKPNNAPVVTRMSSSQNITFINPPASVQPKQVTPPKIDVDEPSSATSDGRTQPPEFVDGLSKTDGGWYVLKKGKAAKSKSPPVEATKPPQELSLAEDFPSLASKSTPPMLKKEPSKSDPVAPNSWRAGVGLCAPKTKQDARQAKSDADAVDEESVKPQERTDLRPSTPLTAKSKKKKKSPVNGNNREGVVNGIANVNKPKRDLPVDTPENRKVKRAEIMLERMSKDAVNGAVDSCTAKPGKSDVAPDRDRKVKHTELKLETVSAAASPAEKSKDIAIEAVNGVADSCTFKNGFDDNAKSSKVKRTELTLETVAENHPQITAVREVFDASDFPDLPPNKRAAAVPAKRRSELKVATLAVAVSEPVMAASEKTVHIENMKNNEDRTKTNGVATFDESDFPDLTARPVTIRIGTAPPGFGKLSRPPPGFVPVAPVVPVNKPPPGFDAVNNPLAPLATFTNSVGQSFSFAQRTYVQPEDSQRRNQELAERLRGVMDGDEERFARFRDISGGYRKGAMGAAEYYNQCVELMGWEKFASIFAELLVLLPDIGRQQELLGVYNEARKAPNQSGAAMTPFLVCASCQQVLAGKDFRAHEDRHALDNFPALDNLLHTSRVSWVKRN